MFFCAVQDFILCSHVLTLKLQEELACYSHVLGIDDHLQTGAEHSDVKRFSRASDTSSAYSGSDVLHTSLDDPDADLSGLGENVGGSDDEEGYAESAEVSDENFFPI